MGAGKQSLSTGVWLKYTTTAAVGAEEGARLRRMWRLCDRAGGAVWGLREGEGSCRDRRQQAVTAGWHHLATIGNLGGC